MIKDYNLEVHYHLGKANVVVDALSQKSHQVEEPPLSLNHAEILAHNTLTSELLEQIIREQKEDPKEIPHIRKLMAKGRGPHFSIDELGVMTYKDRLVVPSNKELKRKILNEAHHSKLSIHPGSNKMYHDLRHLYWWSNMKQDITHTSRNATLVVGLKQIICVPQDICSPCPFWFENGRIFPWISLWVYPAHPRAMTLFGSLWIASPSQIISSQ